MVGLKLDGSLSVRQDIQVVRALAVLSVVIYHIWPSIVPGGFVGVDIFFVVSGYLILGRLCRENLTGKDLVNFYRRRVLRLAPAYFVMVILVSFFFYVVLLPGEFENYFFSYLSSVFFSSNYWFYFQSGYFDASSHYSPLLHTWSLAVEEQFYILLPLILVCFGVGWFRSLVLYVLFSASLFLCLSWAGEKDSLSFYSLSSRVWQFLSGGFAALYFSNRVWSSRFSDFVVWFSVAGLVGCFLFMGAAGFPGWKAIIPTILTCTMLVFGRDARGVDFLLRNRALGYVGDVSYSLYLWHWPIVVFFALIIGGVDSILVGMTVLFLSFVFAVVSYNFVENPIRNGLGLWSDGRVFGAYGAHLLLALCIFGVALHKDRVASDYVKLMESYLNYPAEEYFLEGSCFLTSRSNSVRFFNADDCIVSGRNDVLIIGDSHAAHWSWALRNADNGRLTVSQITASGCKPILEPEGARRCSDLIRFAYREVIPKHRFDTIYISARWNGDELDGLLKTLNYLEDVMPESKVVVLGPVMEYEQDLPRLLIRYGGDIPDRFSRYDAVKEVDLKFRETLSGIGQYVSVLDALCDDEGDCTKSIDGDVPVQFDYGHLTHLGAGYLLEKIIK